MKEIRKLQQRIGVKKIHKMIRKKLKKNGISIGRDRLYDILREESMLIKKKKAFTPKTTNSNHYLPMFKNLLKSCDLTGSNQAWVCDITYIRTEEGFTYAAIIQRPTLVR